MSWKHEWVERWLGYYITIRNYCGAGRGHIEWIINAFKMGGYVILFLMFFGVDSNSFPKWVIPVFSISFLVCTFFLGYSWNYFKGYEIEAEWSNIRNPLFRKIRKNLK